MSPQRYRLHAFFGVAAILAFAACSNPLAPARGAKAAANSGSISVNIRPISPALTDLLQRLKSQSTVAQPTTAARATIPARATATALATIVAQSASATSSRAFLAANSVHFTLYDSSSAVLTSWDILVGADALTQFTTSDFSGVGYVEPNRTVIAGSGYTLKAEIFNDATSSSSPVVAGTSAPFTVVAGSTPTQVTVTCLPLDPAPLVADGTTTTVSLIPWGISSSTNAVTSTGSERWYELNLATTLNWTITATPEAASDYPTAFLFDAAGNLVDFGGSGSHQANVPALGAYFLGIIDTTMSPDLSPQNVDLSVHATPPNPPGPLATNATPNYDLTDQAVALLWNGPSSGQTFNVRRDTDPNFGNPTDVTSASNAAGANSYAYDGSQYYNFKDYTAQLGKTYYYEIAATDTATGEQSAYSYAASLSSAPTNVVASYGGSNDILLSWDALAGADAYSIQLLDSTGALVTDGFINFTTSSIDLPTSFLTNGQTYYFVVQAHINGHGWGYFSISNPVVYGGSAP